MRMEFGAARTEAFEPERPWPTSEPEPEVQAPENVGEPVARNLELPGAMLPTPRPLRLRLRRTGLSLLRALTEVTELRRARSGDGAAGSCRALRGERSSAVAAGAHRRDLRPAPSVAPLRPTLFRSARARSIRWPAKSRQAFPPRAWSSAAASATRSAKLRAPWSAARRLRATIPRTNGQALTPGGKFKTIQARSS